MYICVCHFSASALRDIHVLRRHSRVGTCLREMVIGMYRYIYKYICHVDASALRDIHVLRRHSRVVPCLSEMVIDKYMCMDS